MDPLCLRSSSSHGSPMIALEPGEAGAFIQRLARRSYAVFGRPKAIVTVSRTPPPDSRRSRRAGPAPSDLRLRRLRPALLQMRYDAAAIPPWPRAARAAPGCRHRCREGRRRRPRPRCVDGLALHLSAGRRADRPARLRAGRFTGTAVRARRRAPRPRRRGRADPRQRQHHPQPAAHLRDAEEAGRRAGGGSARCGVPELDRATRQRSRVGRPFAYAAARSPSRASRTAPAALLRTPSRRRTRSPPLLATCCAYAFGPSAARSLGHDGIRIRPSCGRRLRQFATTPSTNHPSLVSLGERAARHRSAGLV